MINTNQHLAFNPKRAPRTDKNTRQGLQFKYKPNHQYKSPAAVHHHAELPYQTSKKDSRVDDRHHQRPVEKDVSYQLASSKYSARESNHQEEHKRKEDLMMRVKKLQNIVMPLVDRDHEDEEKHEIGWQARIQRKITKIQNSLESVKKEWQLQMQRKILEMEEQLRQSYLRIKSRMS